ELVGLADRYLEREMPRAAFEVVKVAAGFAPAGLAAREQQARRDIDSWNAAQVAARAAELQPPADDGAVLREWFATGTPLYAGATTAWRVEGARARVEQLVGGDFAAILPKPGLPPLKSAAIHVHLPAVGCSAGFCLDVVSNSDFAIARLERLPHGLALSAYRWRGEKWTRLAYEDIAMPAWKREGWFDVRLEAGASGIEVHAAGQKITIDQSRLGIAKDRYGLFAGADGKQAVTVEACAFRFSR
ncbi:MAG: hypothetical protein KDE27_29415, partial [Planctomycetes bacterium]|nr:hypothetical protein [Planctomycetota bacterium]